MNKYKKQVKKVKDYSNRDTLEIRDISENEYNKLSSEIISYFNLKAETDKTVGNSEEFQNYILNECIISIEFDIWTGLSIVAKNESAKELVNDIFIYLTDKNSMKLRVQRKVNIYLNDKLDSLIKLGKEEEALELLEEYIKHNPNNYDRKIEYAIYLSNSPFHDDITALEIIDEIVRNNPTNIKALVVKAKMEDIHQIIKDETLELLNKFLKTHEEDAEYYGEILMLKAFYFITFEMYTEAEEVLRSSIKVSPNFSLNYKSLGILYKIKGNSVQEKYFYEIALQKVVKIYRDGDYYSPYSFKGFVKEYIQGIDISDIYYNWLIEKIKSL